MANTTLTQTGAQVQDILDKADKLPSTLGTAGQVLTMNAGATAPEWKTPSGGGGTQLYIHKIVIDSIYKIILCSTRATAVTSVSDLGYLFYGDGTFAMNTPSFNYDDYEVVYNLEAFNFSDVYELRCLILSKAKYSNGSYSLAYTTVTSVATVTDVVTAL